MSEKPEQSTFLITLALVTVVFGILIMPFRAPLLCAFGFLLQLALMLYVAFFLLRDGRILGDTLIEALPLGEERERLLTVL